MSLDSHRRGWRSGHVLVRVLFSLVVLAGLCWLLWYFAPGDANSGDWNGPITTEVTTGPFVFEVIERGSVASSMNVEIRCEVQSRGSSGTTILELVPEGTHVKAGQMLAKLDDSVLQMELLQQEIVCNNSHSQVVEGQADLDAAKLELEEYLEGTFTEEVAKLESAQFIAKESLRRAQEYLQFSERLNQRGYVSSAQLEADQFSVEKYTKELDVATTQLKVLRSYTKKKMVNRLKAAVTTAETRLKSRENSYQLDLSRLERIKDNIEKCTVVAPSAGQVVYANDTNSRSASGDVLIAEGRQVRERQVMFRLPDPSNMQVVAKINESRVDLVKEGMPSRIRLDAFPEVELSGAVEKVSEYPLPQFNRYLEHIKEYGTDITIEDPPPGLRAGMTAEVAILIERQEEVTQIPPQSILERGGSYFCVVRGDSESTLLKRIEVGASNDEAVVIHSGLEAGQHVVLNPGKYESQLAEYFEAAATEGEVTVTLSKLIDDEPEEDE